MGMAASQARLLSITARMTDNENTGQNISTAKIQLADKMDQINKDYLAALDATKLTVLTGFVGSGTDPIPLTDAEIRNMGFDSVPVNIDYDVNDTVNVVNGPLEGFIGTVQEINKEKQKVKVLVSMFGRETPVELEFSQVQKVN